ncbi:N-acetylmuramoyl-L-alanine amidase [Streptacidiphilus sp. P02-A3a]|uniref:N-acetylmuramoyl-L-alanine amidase n=1 Tax=Streptacidiphilus sp. P02-A3a TaxID=2704468 RepID=UPI001CDD31D5|nr:N-acetylmuramoyl-L-alanine amidase [Streptacidiphilus sp. P02-A3a]
MGGAVSVGTSVLATAVAPVLAAGALAGALLGAGGQAAPGGGLPLSGRTVVLDPGHNPGNFSHPGQINRLVDVGNGRKACNTTGTATADGYTEAVFNLDVARRAEAILRAAGATVVLTQDGDRPWGPCVTERAAIATRAHADAAVSIHADGAPPTGYGFQVILPAVVVAGTVDTRPIVGPSRRLGLALRSAFGASTGEARSTYLGRGTALTVRGDLGGLNLSTVPAVFIECGNMANPTDAGRMTTPAWRESAARGIAAGISSYLEHPAG